MVALVAGRIVDLRKIRAIDAHSNNHLREIESKRYVPTQFGGKVNCKTLNFKSSDIYTNLCRRISKRVALTKLKQTKRRNSKNQRFSRFGNFHTTA